jgi:capsular polysaccharide export protein
LFATPDAALRLMRQGSSAVCVWGIRDPPGFEEMVRVAGVDFMRMEDGFVRSVGLGSDFLLPASVCLDRSGIYYDGHRPSDLETLLAQHRFSDSEIERARSLREMLVGRGITKYNLGGEANIDVRALAEGRPVILVPGQVPDDASLARGTGLIRSNIELLKAVRDERPEAFIVYKEHPDVSSGNRPGREERTTIASVADLVLTRSAILPCMEACDEVHVLTSLAGFEALIRDKPVVCWGMPFFAGWSLTRDRIELPRRGRSLSLDELVAGALLTYPRYFNPESGLPCEAEDVLPALVERRQKVSGAPDLRIWNRARRATRWVELELEGLKGSWRP